MSTSNVIRITGKGGGYWEFVLAALPLAPLIQSIALQGKICCLKGLDVAEPVWSRL
jgi:hypothetical protein